MTRNSKATHPVSSDVTTEVEVLESPSTTRETPRASSPPPRGIDAITKFPNNVVNINRGNYMWVKNLSNFTLYHRGSGPPR
jgi:hypothetical protein